MNRRRLLLREPLRRRPYGERSYAPSHERRRDRVPVAVPAYVPAVARRASRAH